VIVRFRLTPHEPRFESEEQFGMEWNPDLLAAFVRQPRQHSVLQIEIRPAKIGRIEASQSGVPQDKKCEQVLTGEMAQARELFVGEWLRAGVCFFARRPF
jgi:hypothetical protein